VIFRNSDSARTTHWQREENPNAAEIARNFLMGEHEILKLVNHRSSAAADLARFLQASADLEISVWRAANGDLLVWAEVCDETLMLTGRTASVVRGYLDEEPVSMQDRFDMTQRLYAT
jgi:hypothetical protein